LHKHRRLTVISTARCQAVVIHPSPQMARLSLTALWSGLSFYQSE
jgi:hypothetical protein